MLPFAVRHYACHGGVMLIASHNPKEYNGYKAYCNDVGQLVASHDKNLRSEFNAIHSVKAIKFERIGENIKLIGSVFDDSYIQSYKRLSIHHEAVTAQ